jgi:hypothetical protein
LRLNTEAVEILVNGRVAGVIYPLDPRGIRIVSAHIGETTKDKEFSGEVVEYDGTSSWPPIPSVNIRFDPSPYRIEGGRIVKLPEN